MQKIGLDWCPSSHHLDTSCPPATSNRHLSPYANLRICLCQESAWQGRFTRVTSWIPADSRTTLGRWLEGDSPKFLLGTGMVRPSVPPFLLLTLLPVWRTEAVTNITLEKTLHLLGLAWHTGIPPKPVSAGRGPKTRKKRRISAGGVCPRGPPTQIFGIYAKNRSRLVPKQPPSRHQLPPIGLQQTPLLTPPHPCNSSQGDPSSLSGCPRTSKHSCQEEEGGNMLLPRGFPMLRGASGDRSWVLLLAICRYGQINL